MHPWKMIHRYFWISPHRSLEGFGLSKLFSWLCAHRKIWMRYIHLHRALFQPKGHRQLNLLHLPNHLTRYHKNELPRDWSFFPTQLWVNASAPMAAVAYNELCTHKTQQFPDKAFPWCSLQYNFGETKMASLSSEWELWDSSWWQ